MNLHAWIDVTLAAFTAAATIAVAWTAWRTIRLNNDWLSVARSQLTALNEEVQAVKSQAEASQRTVEEMRQERELGCAPQLRIVNLDHSCFEVENIGRGPALNCRVAHVDAPTETTSWQSNSTELFPVAASKSSGQLWVSPGSHWHDNILSDLRQLADASMDGLTVCVCEDQLGIKRRFVAGRRMHGHAGALTSPSSPPDVWRPGEQEPAWTRWYS